MEADSGMWVVAYTEFASKDRRVYPICVLRSVSSSDFECSDDTIHPSARSFGRVGNIQKRKRVAEGTRKNRGGAYLNGTF